MTGIVAGGRYRLLHKLAEGGMAEVHLARHEGPGGFERLVVVKRLLPHLAADADFVRMFLDEARTSADLRHPNVVAVHEVVEDAGSWLLVMEYLQGQHLGHVARRCLERAEPFPVEFAARCVADAAAGLHHAHTKVDLRGRPMGIVHRDVSPQNIMLTYDGVTKVLDFGIARTDVQQVRTEPGIVKGKMAYMSPEQASGEDVDARTDVFALGVVLFELTTLRRLFTGRTSAEILAAVLAAPVPPPTLLVPGYPPALEAVVLRALERDVPRRYADAAQLRDALEDVLRGLGQPVTPSVLGGFVQRIFRDVLSNTPAHVAEVVAQEELRSTDAQALPVTERMGRTPLLDVREFAGSTEDATAFLDAVGRFLETPEASRHTNIPPQAGRFVGRESELSSICAASARVVSVVGGPGMGKSRLILQAAMRLGVEDGHPLPGGAWCADLSSITTAEDVCAAVAQALGVTLARGRSVDDAVETLGAAMARRGPMVLVLDPVDGAADALRTLVPAWTLACPDLRVLCAGSQAPAIPGEVVVELGPLPLPARGQRVEEADAVRFFVERARAAGVDLSAEEPLALAALVHQLDGIPLALELAAARLPREGLHALLDRASTADGSPHDALGSALRGTLDHLSDDERSALAQCTVFRGGFTLDAAEAVVVLAPGARPVAEVIRALRTRHLLHAYVNAELPSEARLGMYAWIRDAASRLAPGDVMDGALQRHASHFMLTATRWAGGVERHGGEACLHRLVMERDNLAAVLQRARAGTAQPRLRATEMAACALALDPVLSAQGPLHAQLALLDEVVDAARVHGAGHALQARLLEARGNARRHRGLLAPAVDDLREAETCAMRSQDRRLVARTRCWLGVALFVSGRLEVAQGAWRQALTVTRDTGDRHTEGRVLTFQGILAVVQGRLDDAEAHYRDALVLVRNTGDLLFEGRIAGNMGALQVERGHHAAARPLYEEAIALLRRVRDRRLEGYYTAKLAQAFHEEGALDDALARYEDAMRLLSDAGDRRHLGMARACMGALLAARGNGDAATGLLESAVKLLRDAGDPLLLCAAEVHAGHLDLLRAREHPQDAEPRVAAARIRLRAASVPQAPPTPPRAPGARSVTGLGVGLGRSPRDQNDEVRFACRLLQQALPSP